MMPVSVDGEQMRLAVITCLSLTVTTRPTAEWIAHSSPKPSHGTRRLIT